MANTYDVGDLVRCTGEFKNSLDEYIDPVKVYFKYRCGKTGVITTLEYGKLGDEALERISTGKYACNVNAISAGVWYYRFYSTGLGQSAAEQSFLVRHSDF